MYCEGGAKRQYPNHPVLAVGAVVRELREERGIEVAVAEAAEAVERMIPDAEGRDLGG